MYMYAYRRVTHSEFCARNDFCEIIDISLLDKNINLVLSVLTLSISCRSLISLQYTRIYRGEIDAHTWETNAPQSAADADDERWRRGRERGTRAHAVSVRSAFINMQNQLRPGPTATTVVPVPAVTNIELSGSPPRWPPRSKRSFNSAAFLHSLGNHRVPDAARPPGPFSRSAAKVVSGSTCVPAGAGSPRRAHRRENAAQGETPLG